MNIKKIIVPLCATLLLSVPVIGMAKDVKNTPSGTDLKSDSQKPGKKLSSEQIAERSKIIKEYHKAIEPLHDKLMQKKMELDTFKVHPSATKEELKAIIEEIVKVQGELRQKRTELADTLKAKNLMPIRQDMQNGMYPPPPPQGCDCTQCDKGKHHPKGHPIPPQRMQGKNPGNSSASL